MGYRPHFVEEKKYGDAIWGFSHKVDAFHNILEELGLKIFVLEDNESLEVTADSIKAINTDMLDNVSDELKENLLDFYNDDGYHPADWNELKECLSELIKDLKKGLDTRYCKSCGSVLIEWF